jgi:hypothetical protein
MSAQHQSDAAAMVSAQVADSCNVPHCDAMAIWSLSDRDFRIDLLRGLSLWLIFLDHIPETYLNHLTPKNFGFSDAAENPGVLVRACVGKRLWQRRPSVRYDDRIVASVAARVRNLRCSDCHRCCASGRDRRVCRSTAEPAGSRQPRRLCCQPGRGAVSGDPLEIFAGQSRPAVVDGHSPLRSGAGFAGDDPVANPDPDRFGTALLRLTLV